MSDGRSIRLPSADFCAREPDGWNKCAHFCAYEPNALLSRPSHLLRCFQVRHFRRGLVGCCGFSNTRPARGSTNLLLTNLFLIPRISELKRCIWLVNSNLALNRSKYRIETIIACFCAVNGDSVSDLSVVAVESLRSSAKATSLWDSEN
jgi:hypothetical protein